MLIKLVLKNCVTSIEDSAWTKKELELTFSLNQAYSITSLYSAIVPHRFFYRYIPHGKFW